MRSILCILILFPSCFFSQNRNRHVMILNEVVELMNRASRLNKEYYNRAAEFCGSLCGNYKPEEWFCQVVEKKPLSDFYARGDSVTPKLLTHKVFKELHPDEQGLVYSYESDIIPYLLQREKLKTLLKDAETTMAPDVMAGYATFTGVVDELIASHYDMRNYTRTKQQFKDVGFKSARTICRKFHPVLDNYRTNLNRLWSCIEKDYIQHSPPYESQQAIVRAEKELAESMKLVDAWADDKFNNLLTKDSFHIKTIRSNIHEAMEHSSGYFKNTYGYGDTSMARFKRYPASIQNPALRYEAFYNNLETMIRTNVSPQNPDFNRSDPSKTDYNNKLPHFMWAVDFYNRFIIWADAKKIQAIMKEYYKEHVYTKGLDTSSNILLNRPYPSAYFDCNCVAEKPLSVVQKKDSTVARQTLTLTPDVVVGSSAYDSLAIHQALPHHLVYLLDASSSMNEFGRLNVLKTNTKYLVRLQRREDRLSVVSFASLAHVLIHHQPCNEKTEIFRKIDGIEALGSSNIDAGILKAFEIADSCKIKDGKTKLLLITDGLFKPSKQSLKIIRSLDDHGISFCIIYLGHSQNKGVEDQFKKICTQANGRFYNTQSSDLKDILIKEASD